VTAWLVKYNGVCARCATPLLRGTPAIWDRASRTIRCIECPTIPDAAPSPHADEGKAGASARREYERRVAKRDAAIEQRWGPRFCRVVRAITAEPQSTRAWGIGAWGEEQLGIELAGVPGIRVLHDRRVRGTRRNIDHVVIAPAGVFVVDAKHYQGLIQIRNRGWFFRPDWRLYVGSRDCSRLARSMSWQVEAVVRAMTASGVDPLPSVTPVLCFVRGEWPLFRAPEEFEGVRLEGARSIKKLMVEPHELTDAEIDHLASILAIALPPR